jgi:hypothetical protein
MNTALLQQMAETEAWKAVQRAYEILYGPEEPSATDKREAEKELERANQWLTALKS